MKKQKTKRKNKSKKPQIKLQYGTGPHVDSNPLNLWEKTISDDETKSIPLDRFRIFQSQVTMNKQEKGDSGLEVIPGFYKYCQNYFTITNKHEKHGFNARRPYNRKLMKKYDRDLIDRFVVCQRIPKDWNVNDHPIEYPTGNEDKNQIIKNVIKEWKEHKKLEFEPTQPGDFIIWDIRAVHKNGDNNSTDHCRQTFYHAYLASLDHINGHIINDLRERRKTGLHPIDFPKKYAKIEMNGYKPFQLNELGKRLYNQLDWEDQENKEWTECFKLTDRHIHFFKKYGYVVVENVIDNETIEQLKQDAFNFLKQKSSIDISSIETIKQTLTKGKLSKVAGMFGGMLELYWSKTQEKIRCDPKPYAITKQLFEKTFCLNEKPFNHSLQCQMKPWKLWLYVDRQNLRFPDKIVDFINESNSSNQITNYFKAKHKTQLTDNSPHTTTAINTHHNANNDNSNNKKRKKRKKRNKRVNN